MGGGKTGWRDHCALGDEERRRSGMATGMTLKLARLNGAAKE